MGDGITDMQFADRTLQDNKQMNIEVHGIHENGLQRGKMSRRKNYKLCCFGLSRG